MNFLNYKINNIYNNSINDINKDLLGNLSLTGRHGYYSQDCFGENAVVAVLDTGINWNHPEFENRVIDKLNYCGYGNGIDDNGHGSHCAGTIAGKNTGVAPKAKLISVKVLDGSGGGEFKTVFTNICKALEDLKNWKKDNKKINIVSMSLGAPKDMFSSSLAKRFENAIKELTENNITVICSAGNSGMVEDRYPACFYDPITVSAVDLKQLKPANFITRNKEVDLCQIGVDVLSAWYKGGYAIMSGTSMSTPTVAGIAALVTDKYYKIFKEHIAEDFLYKTLKLNCKDIDVLGVDMKSGAGFCTLQPVVMDLYSKVGNMYITNNGENIELREPVAIVGKGVTSLPAREFTENIFGGYVEYNPENKFARFRV